MAEELHELLEPARRIPPDTVPVPEESESSVQPAATPGDGILRGTVAKVSYRDAVSGFGVIRAEADDTAGAYSGQTATVVGIIPESLAGGTCFIARGEWQMHPRFGKQFRARFLAETPPTSAQGILRYLASGSIKGLGPVLAQRVVEAFGDKTIAVLDENPQRLSEVPGIGRKKLGEIINSWQEKKNIREVLLFFQEHGISIALAQRIYNSYGARAIDVVKRDPFVLAQEVWGIGFHTADRIAQAFGTDINSPSRLRAGLVFALRQASDDGNCFLPREILLTKAVALLQIEDTGLLADCLSKAALADDLVIDRERVYLPDLFLAEKHLAQNISQRLSPGSGFREIPDSIISAASEQVYLDSSFKTSVDSAQDAAPRTLRLSDEQKDAIRLAASRRLMVITGGPGCGKTTVVRTIAMLFRRAGLEVRLTAPTGRAAQRLAEVCEMPASTIHRLLKYDPIQHDFVHDAEDPLVLDAVILDESSMIDVPLACSLFEALPAHARVVVVGDADQLPSVGPGLFLSDLLSIEKVPRVRLTRLFRRTNESLITGIAHDINKGATPHIPEPGAEKADAYFLPCPDVSGAAQLIERLIVEQIPKKFGFRGSDIMVLTPMNQGELGVIALNQRLQQRLVPALPGHPSVKMGDLEFRLGDRVCQRVNNYQLHVNGVFNGDQGEIIGIDATNHKVYVKLWDGREITYGSDTLPQIDLAYALTIHRSQGSEVAVVVLALHDAHHIMLERQLLYTAVTRAKKLLIIVGTRQAVKTATRRIRSRKRFTALAERVTGIVG